MNKTKIIYFLSAFVVIIGCYVLNMSYSMFVDVQESDLVESTVPKLDVTMSLNSVTVEAGKEYLVKQTVTNNSVVPVNFGIKTDKPSNVKLVKNDSIPDNLSYGTRETENTLAENTSKDIYFVVSNIDGTEDITVTFELYSNYSTILAELSDVTNIDNTESNLYELSLGLPYSDKPNSLSYKIIKQYADSKGMTGGDLNTLFSGNTVKVSLPIESSFEVPTLQTVTDIEVEEVGLYAAEDDYGTSYYFRGASSVNYVNFAGFTWRIVRINGDGSVRLILDVPLEYADACTDTTICTTSAFNTSYNDNAYIGYMYGTPKSSNYDSTHDNKTSSTIKTKLDSFYTKYLQTNYKDYMADTIFCGDKTLASGLGYGTNSTNYAAYNRLYSSSTKTPTLECAKGANNDYSRYTVDSYTTTKGITTNGDLTYPIALLTADELVMAGVTTAQSDRTYLYNVIFDGYYYSTGNEYLWCTMTPNGLLYSSSTVFGDLLDGWEASNFGLYNSSVYSYCGVRPVINIKSSVLVNSGSGTSNSPYTLKLS